MTTTNTQSPKESTPKNPAIKTDPKRQQTQKAAKKPGQGKFWFGLVVGSILGGATGVGGYVATQQLLPLSQHEAATLAKEFEAQLAATELRLRNEQSQPANNGHVSEQSLQALASNIQQAIIPRITTLETTIQQTETALKTVQEAMVNLESPVPNTGEQPATAVNSSQPFSSTLLTNTAETVRAQQEELINVASTVTALQQSLKALREQQQVVDASLGKLTSRNQQQVDGAAVQALAQQVLASNNYAMVNLLATQLRIGAPYKTTAALVLEGDSLPEGPRNLLRRYEDTGFNSSFQSFKNAVLATEAALQKQQDEQLPGWKQALASVVTVRKADAHVDTEQLLEKVQAAMAMGDTSTVLERTRYAIGAITNRQKAQGNYQGAASETLLEVWFKQYSDYVTVLTAIGQEQRRLSKTVQRQDIPQVVITPASGE